jgi:hypothetical protein
MHSFTSDDLLLYLYKETSEEMTVAIEAALETDYALREALNELKASIRNLNQENFAPRPQTIEKILQYAERSVGELTAEA